MYYLKEQIPFQIIDRPTAGSWDGQDSNQYYVIDEEKSEITLWYVFGKKPVIEKPVITKADPRYLCLEYENDTLTTTPEFYSWTTGIEEKVRKPFESDGNGKWKIKVPVKSTCTKVDFVVVLDPSGSDWIKELFQIYIQRIFRKVPQNFSVNHFIMPIP